LPGLGVVTADFNDDGWPDLFVGQANQLLLSTAKGTYRTVNSEVFASKLNSRGGEFPCGTAFGDIDNDGDYDLITADHCDGARIHLFLNVGMREGVPQFKDISKEAGLGFVLPARHSSGRRLRFDLAEIQDFDNDGFPDILVGAVYEEGSKLQPFVCRNQGVKDGVPRFTVPPVAKVVAHFPAAPTADYNRDGRMDVFLCSWFPDVSSRLFLNDSPARHWLQVRVVGKTINRMGIGARVRVYQPGQVGKAAGLLGSNEIHLSQGYCSGREAEVHFGLGDRTKVDVEVELPFGKGRILQKDVAANQVLIVQEQAR
jgi:hypothetical protein